MQTPEMHWITPSSYGPALLYIEVHLNRVTKIKSSNCVYYSVHLTKVYEEDRFNGDL